EVDVDARVVHHRVDVRRPLLDAVLLRDLPDRVLPATDEDRLDLHPRAVLELDAARLPDRQDRADEVLAVAHPAGDAVHGDPQGARGHVLSNETNLVGQTGDALSNLVSAFHAVKAFAVGA